MGMTTTRLLLLLLTTKKGNDDDEINVKVGTNDDSNQSTMTVETPHTTTHASEPVRATTHCPSTTPIIDPNVGTKKDRSGAPLGDLRASDDGTVGEDGRCLDNESPDGVPVRNALCCVAGVVFRSTGIL